MIENAAHGITHLADMNMTYGIRHITIERGYDPRDFVLLAFGGAAGLSATKWATELEIRPPAVATCATSGISWLDVVHSPCGSSSSCTRTYSRGECRRVRLFNAPLPSRAAAR